MGGEGEEAAVFKVAGFTFFADFDSGNLGHVRQDADEEIDDEVDEEDNEEGETARPSTSGGQGQGRSVGSESPDYRFSLWTRPDCQGTEFENGNRTWFYFGMRGGPPGSVVQFTLQNLNKQNKLFSQGMAPVFQVVISAFLRINFLIFCLLGARQSRLGESEGSPQLLGH